MARGKSGRVVLEVDPELKQQLYAMLTYRQLTMKDWFVMEAESYINNETQLSLFAPTTDDRNASKRGLVANPEKRDRAD